MKQQAGCPAVQELVILRSETKGDHRENYKKIFKTVYSDVTEERANYIEVEASSAMQEEGSIFCCHRGPIPVVRQTCTLLHPRIHTVMLVL